MTFANVRNNKIIDFNCNYLDDDIKRIETTKELYEAYLEDRNKVIFLDNKIILNPDYEKELAKKREEKFNKLFFNTSLGYIKRQVTMKDGTIKSFLTDIVPLLQVGIPIISYDKPDFTTEDMPKQNTDKIVTDEFINECKQQVLKDFYGANEI